MAGPVAEVLERLAEKFGSKASVSAVFGEPVERDGITIIPVAKVGFGFGGGVGNGKKDAEITQQGGGGGGASAAENSSVWPPASRNPDMTVSSSGAAAATSAYPRAPWRPGPWGTGHVDSSSTR